MSCPAIFSRTDRIRFSADVVAFAALFAAASPRFSRAASHSFSFESRNFAMASAALIARSEVRASMSATFNP